MDNDEQARRRAAYREKFQDVRWQKRRLEVLSRDKWTCQLCFDNAEAFQERIAAGEEAGARLQLHVHHKYYLDGKEPWDYPLDAFATLCESCHEWETQNRFPIERKLVQTIKEKGFFAGDLLDIAAGFYRLQPFHVHYVMASVIAYALGTPEVLARLTEEYFADLKRRAEAREVKVDKVPS